MSKHSIILPASTLEVVEGTDRPSPSNLPPDNTSWLLNRWTGFAQPAFSERYIFTMEANDGARLWVGDQLMFDKFDEVGNSYDLITTAIDRGEPKDWTLYQPPAPTHFMVQKKLEKLLIELVLHQIRLWSYQPNV